MLSFSQPLVLLALPLAILVGVRWHRRPRTSLAFSSAALLHGLPTGRARLAIRLSIGLRVLCVVSLIVSIANPRLPDGATRLPVEGVAIALVCDGSGSMGTTDFPGENNGPAVSRLNAAKRALSNFVQGTTTPNASFPGRAADPIALIVFAAWPTTECPLTLNHSVLLSIMNEVEPRQGLDAGTNIGDAIAEGILRLRSARGTRKVIILLSDGEHNATQPDVLSPLQAAQLAANLQYPIYTIDCGGALSPTAAAEEILQRESGKRSLELVAELTGGRAFAANSEAELIDIYRQLDQLERQPTVSYQYRRYHELGDAFTMLALGALVLLWILEHVIWRKIPGFAGRTAGVA